MIHNINYSDAHLLCTTTDVREARMYNTINVIVLLRTPLPSGRQDPSN